MVPLLRLSKISSVTIALALKEGSIMETMNFVLFFAGVLLLQMTGIQCNHSQEIIDACAKELKIPEGLMKEGWRNNLNRTEFRCFLACLLEKNDILEPDNKINMRKKIEILKKRHGDQAEKIIKIYEDCIKEVKGVADKCDYVNAVFACVHNKVEHEKQKESKPAASWRITEMATSFFQRKE